MDNNQFSKLLIENYYNNLNENTTNPPRLRPPFTNGGPPLSPYVPQSPGFNNGYPNIGTVPNTPIDVPSDNSSGSNTGNDPDAISAPPTNVGGWGDNVMYPQPGQLPRPFVRAPIVGPPAPNQTVPPGSPNGTFQNPTVNSPREIWIREEYPRGSGEYRWFKMYLMLPTIANPNLVPYYYYAEGGAGGLFEFGNENPPEGGMYWDPTSRIFRKYWSHSDWDWRWYNPWSWPMFGN